MNHIRILIVLNFFLQLICIGALFISAFTDLAYSFSSISFHQYDVPNNQDFLFPVWAIINSAAVDLLAHTSWPTFTKI